MAVGKNKSDLVWLRNVQTGRVEGVTKGSPAHKAMGRDLVKDADGVPHPLWVPAKAPKRTGPVKYKSGADPTWVAGYKDRPGPHGVDAVDGKPDSELGSSDGDAADDDDSDAGGDGK